MSTALQVLVIVSIRPMFVFAGAYGVRLVEAAAGVSINVGITVLGVGLQKSVARACDSTV